MVYSAAAGMVSAVRSTCAEASYQGEPGAGESGCGNGALERRSPLRRRDDMDRNVTTSSLDKRLPPTDPDGTDPVECTYFSKMCTGPRVISTCTSPFIWYQPFENTY